jgi:hypothetical protein
VTRKSGRWPNNKDYLWAQRLQLRYAEVILATDFFDLMPLASFIGPNGLYPTVGLEAVKRARQSGLSDEQIKHMALEESLTFGTKAKESLQILDKKQD